MLVIRVLGLVTLLTLPLVPNISWSAHPLITDDSSTQGKGKFQLEVNGRYDNDRETAAGVSISATGGQAAMTLTYGIADSIDLAAGMPYVWIKTKSEDGLSNSNVSGISDTSVEVKWRFFEKDGLSLALKPGLTFPTGDENKGLGTGKTGYHVFLITTRESGPWTFHANLGYIRNENRFEEQIDLWHGSIAATYAVKNDMKIVVDAGAERNRDKSFHNEPAYLLAGLIYSVYENFDVDLGVKYGMTSAETDWSLLAGTTFRF